MISYWAGWLLLYISGYRITISYCTTILLIDPPSGIKPNDRTLRTVMLIFCAFWPLLGLYSIVHWLLAADNSVEKKRTEFVERVRKNLGRIT